MFHYLLGFKPFSIWCHDGAHDNNFLNMCWKMAEFLKVRAPDIKNCKLRAFFLAGHCVMAS